MHNFTTDYKTPERATMFALLSRLVLALSLLLSVSLATAWAWDTSDNTARAQQAQLPTQTNSAQQ